VVDKEQEQVQQISSRSTKCLFFAGPHVWQKFYSFNNSARDFTH